MGCDGRKTSGWRRGTLRLERRSGERAALMRELLGTWARMRAFKQTAFVAELQDGRIFNISKAHQLQS